MWGWGTNLQVVRARGGQKHQPSGGWNNHRLSLPARLLLSISENTVDGSEFSRDKAAAESPKSLQFRELFTTTSTSKQLGWVGFMNKYYVYHLRVNHSGQFSMSRIICPKCNIASFKVVPNFIETCLAVENILKLSLVPSRWFSYSFGTVSAFHVKIALFTAWKRLKNRC